MSYTRRHSYPLEACGARLPPPRFPLKLPRILLIFILAAALVDRRLPTLPGWLLVKLPSGECRIRTYEGRSQQIYSLSPLTAWVTRRHFQRHALSMQQYCQCSGIADETAAQDERAYPERQAEL